MTHAIDTIFYRRESRSASAGTRVARDPSARQTSVHACTNGSRRGRVPATGPKSHPTFAVLVEYGYPLTRESYLNVNDVDEDDLDAEQESELPDLFQESMIEERVASVMFEIEIDDTLRQLAEGAR